MIIVPMYYTEGVLTGVTGFDVAGIAYAERQ